MKTEYILYVVRDDEVRSWYMLSFDTMADALDAQANLPDSDIFGNIASYRIVKVNLDERRSK